MTVLAECPVCHRKQSSRNKVCKCGENLDTAKRSKRVRYWINYRVDGKQRREYVSKSKTDADTRDRERRKMVDEGSSAEDIDAQRHWTFQNLTDWFLENKKSDEFRSYDRAEGALNKFNEVFGSRLVRSIKPLEIEKYQKDRIEVGRKRATVDYEITYAKQAVKVGVKAFKAFNRIKKLLVTGTNARDRKFSANEFIKLLDKAPEHLRHVLIVAINTGMRKGEIRKLKWSMVDPDLKFFRLPAEIIKEGRKTTKPKVIPVSNNVRRVLVALRRPQVVKTGRTDHVFTYRGEPIKSSGGLRRSFKKACEDAKIPYGAKVKNGVQFRDIRTTVKTWMLNAGVRGAYRDTILGHSLKGMDKYYIKPDETNIAGAMTLYTDWLNAQLGDEFGQRLVNMVG